jgi:hypothetical protein
MHIVIFGQVKKFPLNKDHADMKVICRLTNANDVFQKV